VKFLLSGREDVLVEIVEVVETIMFNRRRTQTGADILFFGTGCLRQHTDYTDKK